MRQLILAATVGVTLCAPGAWAQSRPAPRAAQAPHEHGSHSQAHKTATGVKLAANPSPTGKMYTLRLGPFTLPANSDHLAVAQAPDRVWEVPFDAG